MVAVALVASVLLCLPGSAAAAPKRQVPPHFLGIVADGPLMEDASLTTAGTSLEQELDLMVATGVESVRLSFYWALMQPYGSWEQVPPAEAGRFRDVAGVPTDFRETDRIIGLASARGLSLLPVVLRAPDWGARFPGESASPPRDARSYAAFVRALAERYGSDGSFWRERSDLPRLPLRDWQLWNEPTLQSFWLTQPFASDYVTLLRAARPALRDADSRARIVLAGLVWESWDALEKIYRAGGRSLFDAVALHPFTRRPDDVLRIIERNRTVMARHRDGAKPIYISELSWPSSRGQIPIRYGYETNERGQARRLAAALRLLAANRRRLRLRHVYWYTWVTREIHPSYPFDYTGLRRLQRTSMRSKPALRAYRRTALALEGCAAKRAIATRCR